MQTMSTYFEKFREAIEPDKERKEEAQKADDSVRDHLETHGSFSDRHVNTFLYGSYKRSTAEGNIKDVDLVVVTNYTTDDDPLDVLDDLKDSLIELYGEADLADQRRSIRVDRPLPNNPSSKLTLDVIPAILQDEDDPEGYLWVPDREKKCWIPSHPKGHISYTTELNAKSHQERAFVRLTKMMKWAWKYQFKKRRPGVASHERKPKGFWIEVMTGEYADLSKEAYPELIVSLLENAFNAFKSFRTTGKMPNLPDPGLRDYHDAAYRNIKTSMTEEEFGLFLDTLEECLGWARDALNAKTERIASENWRRIFGDEFPLAPEESTNDDLLTPAGSSGLSFPNRPLQPRKPGGFA